MTKWNAESFIFLYRYPIAVGYTNNALERRSLKGSSQRTTHKMCFLDGRLLWPSNEFQLSCLLANLVTSSNYLLLLKLTSMMMLQASEHGACLVIIEDQIMCKWLFLYISYFETFGF